MQHSRIHAEGKAIERSIYRDFVIDPGNDLTRIRLCHELLERPLGLCLKVPFNLDGVAPLKPCACASYKSTYSHLVSYMLYFWGSLLHLCPSSKCIWMELDMSLKVLEYVQIYMFRVIDTNLHARARMRHGDNRIHAASSNAR